MSVNLFYPGNQSLAQRCTELMDDIVNMQSDINGQFDDNKTVSDDLHALVNSIMAAHGYKTYDQLKDAMLKELTPDQRKQIEDELNKSADIMKGLDITFQVCMLITAVTGVVGLGTKAFMLVRSGALTNVFASRVGFIVDFFKTGRTTLTASEKAAEGIVDAAAEAGGEAAAEASTMGTRVVRFCKIISFVAVALDVFLIGLAAYEGHEQQQELIKNIHYLNTRRMITKLYHRQAKSLVDFSGQLKSVLTLMSMDKPVPGQPDPFASAIQALEDGFIADVDRVWKTYGVLQAYDDLSQIDAARKSDLSQDLSLEDIKNEISKDPNAPVQGPTAPPSKPAN